jgi:hypothetical protein
MILHFLHKFGLITIVDHLMGPDKTREEIGEPEFGDFFIESGKEEFLFVEEFEVTLSLLQE